MGGGNIMCSFLEPSCLKSAQRGSENGPLSIAPRQWTFLLTRSQRLSVIGCQGNALDASPIARPARTAASD